MSALGQTAQILTCSIMKKPHTGLDDRMNILLSCFRKRMSDRDRVRATGRRGPAVPVELYLGVSGRLLRRRRRWHLSRHANLTHSLALSILLEGPTIKDIQKML